VSEIGRFRPARQALIAALQLRRGSWRYRCTSLRPLISPRADLLAPRPAARSVCCFTLYTACACTVASQVCWCGS
jgi:hypothetical protein